MKQSRLFKLWTFIAHSERCPILIAVVCSVIVVYWYFQ